MIKKLSILLSLLILSLSVLTSQQAEAKNKIWNKPKGTIIWAKDADSIAKKIKNCLGKDMIYYNNFDINALTDDELETLTKNQSCRLEIMKFNKDILGYHQIPGASVQDFVTFRYKNNNNVKYTANKRAMKEEKITKTLFSFYKKNKITKLNYAYTNFATQHKSYYYIFNKKNGIIYYENGKIYKDYFRKPLTLKQFKYYIKNVTTPYEFQ